MTVAFFTHAACLEHDQGPGHPEQPARLRAVVRALEAAEFATLDRRTAPVAALTAIERVHTPAYVHAIRTAEPAAGGWVTLDADTRMNHGSLQAALRAVGGAMAAVDAVMDGGARHAFVAARPPGHHAEPDRAMGFCLFNSVAVAAWHARETWGLTRIAVVDFDVHHGNGTQAMFWDDPDLFFASTHQSPCYPGSGARTETGVDHNIVNRPLPPGSGGTHFRAAWEDIFVHLTRFAPELVLVSAGFDAHAADPLAALELDEGDFAWIARRLAEVSGGRLVCVLEGGYDLDALASSVAAFVRVLIEEDAAHG